jgi:hypothetical protein
MKLCKDCVHYVPGRVYDGCSGPHIQPSVIDGERWSSLPDARRIGGALLNRGVRPCGEEGLWWEAPPPRKSLWQMLKEACA